MVVVAGFVIGGDVVRPASRIRRDGVSGCGVGSITTPARVRSVTGAQASGGFEHQGVHERLGQVAAQLMLASVIFLAEQFRRSAC
jgi:hypothetical protein